MSRDDYGDMEREIRELREELRILKKRTPRHSGSLVDYDENIKSILQSIVDFIFGFDNDGKFIFAHTPRGKKFMMPPEDFIGKKHDEVLPQNISNDFDKALKLSRRGEVSEYEYSIDDNGHKLWFLAKISPFIINDENIGAIAVVRDITHYKRNEEILRIKEQLHRSINGDVSDFAFSMRLHEKGNVEFEWISDNTGLPAIRTGTQYPVDILLGTIPAPDREHLMELAKDLVAQEIGVESRVRIMSGELIKVFRVRLESYRNAENKVDRILGAAVDVTGKEETELAMSDAGKWIDSIMREVPLMHIIVNPEGVIVHANNEWLKKMGYEKQDVKLQPFEKFVEEGLKEFQAHFCKQPKSAINQIDISLRHREGDVIHFRMFASMPGNDNHMHCILTEKSEE